MAKVSIEIKSNGYTCEQVQNSIKMFNGAAGYLFDECVISHFYYGDYLSMSTIKLSNGNYGDFNISKNRISFNGHTCSQDNYNLFSKLTLNDELHVGQIKELYDLSITKC